MKCNRCEKESDALRRLVWCPDSKRPLTFLCLLCWADLQVWLKRPPKNLLLALNSFESAILSEYKKDLLLEGEDGRVDHVRPMGVEESKS